MATWKEKLTGKYTWTPPKKNTTRDDENGYANLKNLTPSSSASNVIKAPTSNVNQNVIKTPSYPSSLVQKNIDAANARNARTAEFNSIYEIMSNFDGEQTAYDPLYDAVKNLENGGHDYNAVYKAMENIGGESAMYDPVYDFVKKLEKENGFDVPNIFDQRNEVVSALDGRIPHADKVTEFLTQNPTHSYDVMGYPTQKPTTPTVSSAVASAMAKLQELRKKTYTDPYGDDLNRMIEEFNNRKAFDYQLNTDQLFLNAREQYMQQGQKAMRDAMGAAATMTGGYGNSYASQVGNQAYQQYLQELNNSIPEFYGAALDKYNAEGQQMLDKINLKDAQRKDDYAMWETQYLRDLENAALDYDMAVADEQEKALEGTTVWDRLSDEDKMKYTLEYAKLGLNPDGSPLTYTDASGKVVASPVGGTSGGKVSISDAKNKNAVFDEITRITKEQGQDAATIYAAQLVAAGYPEDEINDHLADLQREGVDSLYNQLKDVNNWYATDMGGIDVSAGRLNDNKRIRNSVTGDEFTLAEAYDMLVQSGVSKEAARDVLEAYNSTSYGGNEITVREPNGDESKLSAEDITDLLSGAWDVENKNTPYIGNLADNMIVKNPKTGKTYRLDDLMAALQKIGYTDAGAKYALTSYSLQGFNPINRFMSEFIKK